MKRDFSMNDERRDPATPKAGSVDAAAKAGERSNNGNPGARAEAGVLLAAQARVSGVGSAGISLGVPAPADAGMLTVAVVSASLSESSATERLGRKTGEAVSAAFNQIGVAVQVVPVELKNLAHSIVNALLTHFPDDQLEDAFAVLEGADAVLAFTPAYNASYSGLFKLFFDVLDPDTLRGKPMIIGATGGSVRHSLILDHALRPLFAFLHANVVPTGIFVATQDWGMSSSESDDVSGLSVGGSSLGRLGVGGSNVDSSGVGSLHTEDLTEDRSVGGAAARRGLRAGFSEVGGAGMDRRIWQAAQELVQYMGYAAGVQVVTASGNLSRAVTSSQVTRTAPGIPTAPAMPAAPGMPAARAVEAAQTAQAPAEHPEAAGAIGEIDGDIDGEMGGKVSSSAEAADGDGRQGGRTVLGGSALSPEWIASPTRTPVKGRDVRAAQAIRSMSSDELLKLEPEQLYPDFKSFDQLL
ncbi:MAG: NAD(P)H-dependent oxidoreductase [Actinomycetaceae bacterium]|nr:NAD(P)H-dependent oxidoreductase [Actinomycetaceae bacterium]